jgi:putative ABC transport system permease protein
MKYFPLVWAILSRRPLRSALTFLSIAVAFLLFGVLHGVTAGFNALIGSLSDSRAYIQDRQSFTRWMPIAMRTQIASVPGVQSVMPYAYFGGYYQDPRNQLGAGAVDFSQLLKVFPEIELPHPQWEAALQNRTAVIVGAKLARKYGWKVGERIPIGTPIWQHSNGSYAWAFDIAGIYRSRSTALSENGLWLSIAYFSQAGGMRNQASQFILAVDKSADAASVCRTIDAHFSNSPYPTLCQTEKAQARAQLRSIGNIRFMVDAIVGAVLFTLLALTANTMMQSVRERMTELAVLKTMGYTNPIVAGLVALEALLLSMSAALCGLLPAMLAFPSVFSDLGLNIGHLAMPPSVMVEGLLTAAALALVSSILPVWRAMRLDVAMALAAR